MARTKSDEAINRAAFVNGRRLAYIETGRGLPLVLLHGIGSAARSWIPPIERLAQQYRIVAWDAPGYGGSDALGIDTPATAHYADALAGFLGELGIERPVLVGHSLGALMAMSYAKHNPADVAALVLADPALGYGRADADLRERKLADRIAMFERLGPEKLGEERGPNLLSSSAPPHAIRAVCETMSKVRADGYLPAARMLATGDLLADARGFTGPVLVMCGAEDTITPPSDAAEVVSAIPGSRYREIPGAGHASYIEQPELFAAEIASFLDSLELAAAARGRA